MTDDIVTSTPTGAAPLVRPPRASPVAASWAWVGPAAVLRVPVPVPHRPGVQRRSRRRSRPRTAASRSRRCVEAFSGQNRQAFWFSIEFSAGRRRSSASCFGTLLAYAAATATRPTLAAQRSSPSFSGVAANMGGLAAGVRVHHPARAARACSPRSSTRASARPLRPAASTSATSAGSIVVYSYFKIPLMVLITLPAIDGLKPVVARGVRQPRRHHVHVLAPRRPAGAGAVDARRLPAAVRQLVQRLRHRCTRSPTTPTIVSRAHRLLPRRRRRHRRGRRRLRARGVDDHHHGVCMASYWVARKRAERWQHDAPTDALRTAGHDARPPAPTPAERGSAGSVPNLVLIVARAVLPRCRCSSTGPATRCRTCRCRLLGWDTLFDKWSLERRQPRRSTRTQLLADALQLSLKLAVGTVLLTLRAAAADGALGAPAAAAGRGRSSSS